MEWEWKEEWHAYRKDNGTECVLLNKQLFDRWAIQFYETLDSMTAKEEVVSYDLKESMNLGDEWLGFK